jgi:hypothetical protein
MSSPCDREWAGINDGGGAPDRAVEGGRTPARMYRLLKSEDADPDPEDPGPGPSPSPCDVPINLCRMSMCWSRASRCAAPAYRCCDAESLVSNEFNKVGFSDRPP